MDVANLRVESHKAQTLDPVKLVQNHVQMLGQFHVAGAT